MANRILKKKYCRIEFTLVSPLVIGSGNNEHTDSDIVKDVQGRPYIPASAIAGVTKELLMDYAGEEVEKYYGKIDRADDQAEPKSSKNMSKGSSEEEKQDAGGKKKHPVKKIESSVIFYDATLKKDSPNVITVRDSVALDEYKTSKKGAKFDMEVLEAGAEFVTYLEQNYYLEDIEKRETDYLEKIVGVMDSGDALLGRKTTRGYGRIRVDSVSYKEFLFDKMGESDEKTDTVSGDMRGQDDQKEPVFNEWLKFDLFSPDSVWDDGETHAASKHERKELILSLRQNGGISIRRYTTAPREDVNIAVPDYEQLTASRMEKEKSAEKAEENIPVIPGTSWAGAFRHRMQEFLGKGNEKILNDIFGYVEKKDDNVRSGKKTDDTASEKDKPGAARSKIYFSESRIQNAKSMIISRNAIDRFTGGTVDGALYTEKTYIGGSTELRIGWNGKTKMDKSAINALAATITDLHYGYLAVGGETSIGRGLFSVEKINVEAAEEHMSKETVCQKNSQTDDETDTFYLKVLEKVKEVFGGGRK